MAVEIGAVRASASLDAASFEAGVKKARSSLRVLEGGFRETSREAMRSVENMARAWDGSAKRATSAAQDQINALTGVDRASKNASATSKAWARQLDRQAQSFDRLRASLDPVYSSSKQYEAAVKKINLAVRSGIVSRAEANRVLEQAEAQYLGTGNAAKRAGTAISASNAAAHRASGGFRNLGMQLNQVAQVGGMTGNWMQAIAIQLPDMLLGFGSVGIAAGVLAGALIPLVNNLGSAGSEADEATANIDVLARAVDRLAGVSQATAADIDAYLGVAFVSVSKQVQALIDDLREAEFSVISHNIRREVESSVVELNRLSGAFEVFWADFMNPGSIDAGYVDQVKEIIRVAGIAYDEFQQLEDAVESVFASQSVHDFVNRLAVARDLANEIGGPVGDAVASALLDAATRGGVLNRVLAEASGAAADAANNAGEVAGRLNIAANAAIGLRNALADADAAIGTLGLDVERKIAVIKARNLAIQQGTNESVAGEITLLRQKLGEQVKGLAAAGATTDQIAAQTGELSSQITVYEGLMKKNADLRQSVKATGKSGGSAGKAIAKGMSEAEKAAQRLHGRFEGELTSDVRNLTDVLSEGLLNGFDGTLRSIGDLFKGWLSRMISTALANPILVSMGINPLGSAIGVAGSAGTAGQAGGGLLGNIGGGLIGSGGFFGSIGSGALGLGNALFGAGGGLGAAGAYLSSVLGTATSSLGAFGAAIGAFGSIALPLIGIGVALKKAFSREYRGSGIRGTFGVDGFEGQGFDFYKGGAFRSDKTSYKALDSEMQALLDQSMGTITDSVRDAADALSLSSKRIGEIATEQFTIWTHDKSPEEAMQALQDEIGKTGDAMAELVLGTTRFTRTGETALETLSRLSTSLVSVNDALDLLDKTALDASLRGADAASDLADAFGGIDAMGQAVTAYFQAFYSEGEQIDTAARRLSDSFERMGLIMPTTRAGFRSLVDGMDLTTERGRDLYAELIGLAGAMDKVLPAASSLTREMDRLVNTIVGDIAEMSAAAQLDMREAQDLAGLWSRTAETLRDFLSDLLNTNLTAASGAQVSALNLARFERAARQARRGNADAAGSLPELAQNYLTTARANATTEIGFRMVASQVQRQLELAAKVAKKEETDAERIARLFDTQINILGGISDALLSGELTADQVAKMQRQIAILSDISEAINSGDVTARQMRQFEKALVGITGEMKSPLTTLNGGLSTLRSRLADLQRAIQADTAERKKAEKIEALQQRAAALSTNYLSGAASIVSQIHDLENATGGSLVNGSKDATLRVNKDGTISYSATGVKGLDNETFAQWQRQFWASGGLQQQIGQHNRSVTQSETQLEALRRQIRNLGGVPAFATGGTHRGGLARVGENNMELVAPSRIYSPSETRGMLDQRDTVNELRQLRREMAGMRDEQRQLGLQVVENSRKIAAIQRKWDVIGQPVRVTEMPEEEA